MFESFFTTVKKPQICILPSFAIGEAAALSFRISYINTEETNLIKYKTFY